MVLIAIDKHSRKILGYLCKNDQTFAYCCSECDVEFTTAFDLEEHMIEHEQKSNDTIQQIALVDDDKSDEKIEQCEKPEEKCEEEKCVEEKPDEEKCAEEKPDEEKCEEEKPEEKCDEKHEESSNEVEVPSKQLSSIERENLLKIKYQVMPCSVRLRRDASIDSRKFLSETLNIAGAEQGSTSSEAEPNERAERLIEETDTPNESIESTESSPPSRTKSRTSIVSDDDIPLKQLKRKRMPPKKPSADLISTDGLISIKRRKTPIAVTAAAATTITTIATQKTNSTASANKKPKLSPMKTKPSPQKSVCFLCGEQFATGIQLTQHQKTHFASTISHAPVFPCNVCGRKVKNLKIHLRLHKNEGKSDQSSQQQQKPPSANGKVVKRPSKNPSKSNESQKSKSASKSGGAMIPKGARAKLPEFCETVAAVQTPAVLERPTVMPSDTLVKLAEASSSTDAVYSKIPYAISDETELISSNEVLTTNSNDSIASSYNLIGDCVTDTDALLLFADAIMLPPPPLSSSTASCVAIIDPTFAPSAIDPLSNLMDVDPLEIPSMSNFHNLEPISVNEPSQSTLAIECDDVNGPSQINDVYQPNGLSVDKRKKIQKSSDEEEQQEQEQPLAAAVENQTLFKCPKCPRHFDTLDRVTKHCEKHGEKMNCKHCGKLLAKSYVYAHISKYHKNRNDIGIIPLSTATEDGVAGDEDIEDDDNEEEEKEEEEVPPTMVVEETNNETEMAEDQEAPAAV